MPEYGLASGREGLLPWRWAVERLEASRNYWLSTVRADGRPHAMAVWAVWLEDALLFSTGAASRKARNLARSPECVLTTERADEAVIVEGVAKLVRERARLARLRTVYLAKYGSGFPADSNVYAVRPRVVFGFIERAEDFAASATRWRFAGRR
jgi:Pyridoxamine 5'-phosphate oxidase